MSKNKGNPQRLSTGEQKALAERAQLQHQQQQAYQQQMAAQQEARALEVRLRVAGWATTLLSGDPVTDLDDADIKRAVDVAMRALDATDAAFEQRRLTNERADGLKAEVDALQARLSRVSTELTRRQSPEPVAAAVATPEPVAAETRDERD